MRYAKLITEDLVNGEGVCVSLFMQGCPHHCPGCFNPETWNFNGGQEIGIDVLIINIIEAIGRNGIQRNFSILGGEPLCPQNIPNTMTIIDAIRAAYPDIKIFVWTGYEKEQIDVMGESEQLYASINKLITGPFIMAERDITNHWAGSRNQQIFDF